MIAAAALLVAATFHAQEIWRLDNLKTIGGHGVTVYGKPSVVRVDGGAQAVHFDGVHDGLLVDGNPLAGASAFTIELLFCPEEGGNEAQRFFHLEDANNRRALLELRANGKGGWWLDAFLRSILTPGLKGLTLIDPTHVHPTGKWYWLAMRSDGRHLAAFVNGVKELEGEHALTPFAAGKISLGVRQNLVYWFKGSIREVRFHREALADDKLQKP